MARSLDRRVAQTGLAMAAQLIHVVRHAHAGDPSAWTLDDDLRPLSERGIGQAERLVGVLAVPRPAVVYSSPSLRCLATVLPLAGYLSLPLTTPAGAVRGRWRRGPDRSPCGGAVAGGGLHARRRPRRPPLAAPGQGNHPAVAAHREGLDVDTRGHRSRDQLGEIRATALSGRPAPTPARGESRGRRQGARGGRGRW